MTLHITLDDGTLACYDHESATWSRVSEDGTVISSGHKRLSDLTRTPDTASVL